jgi:hypothetical protein
MHDICSCSYLENCGSVQEHSIQVQKIPFSKSTSIQFSLAFGTVRWKNFDDLLLAFACLYHSPRLRKAMAADSASSFGTEMLKPFQAVHQDFVKVLRKYANSTIICNRVPIEPKVRPSCDISQCWIPHEMTWQTACRHCCVS